MRSSTKVGIAGIILGLILLSLSADRCCTSGSTVVVLAVAIPVGGYLALDKSQRRRVREIRARPRLVLIFR